MRRRRTTFALLIDQMDLLHGGYEYELRATFHEGCRLHGVNLHLVYGRVIDGGSGETLGHNVIYSYLDSTCVDAIIVLASNLSCRSGVTGLERFLRQFAPVPVVSIGIPMPRIPSVTADGAEGLSRLVEHLIVSHGRRRLAFINGVPGNPEAVARYRAYQRTLLQYGLEVDPALLEVGHFELQGGERAARALLQRGVVFDAIVSANDTMALGAMDVLRSEGIRIGDQLSVVGFDDLAVASSCNPPLTTVRQPFRSIADAAIRLALQLTQGQATNSTIEIPCEPVIRRSCGCWGMGEATSCVEVAISDARHEPSLRSTTLRPMPVLKLEPARYSERIIEALERQLQGESDALLRTFEAIIAEDPSDISRILMLDRAVRRLRADFLKRGELELEELWHSLRDTLALSANAVSNNNALELYATNVKLLTSNERLSGALEMSTLASACSECLIGVGLTTAAVGRCMDGTDRNLLLMACLRDGKSSDRVNSILTPAELLGALTCADNTAMTTLVFPLAMGSTLFGIVVFAYHPEWRGYVQFRDQIAVALRNVALHDSLVEQTLLHERSVQERLATANRLEAVGTLAGCVAHDLNNALGPLVALPEVLLKEIIEAGGSLQSRAELLFDMETIRAASLRAADIVKDLLTMGRQGRVPRAPVELNSIVRRSVETDVSRIFPTGRGRIRFSIDLEPEPIYLLGSETQLSRALLNLIRNAAEAIVGDGSVSISTRVEEVEQPLGTFERIEAGMFGVVRVTDTGAGIPVHQIQRIFEPYFSGKRANGESGTGLGLAIVHGVVKEHEGYIDVKTSVGGGTTFTLYFPLTDQRRRASSRSAPSRHSAARIWVIDDDPVQLRTAKRVLNALGYAVETFDSGPKLMAAFRAHVGREGTPCDLVLLDMVLGEQEDGLGLLDHIRALFPAQRAMIVSGFAAVERAKLAEYKGLDWLVKPYTTATIGSAVAAALR
jgi:phosphoserine phosphatase RsbU/P